MSVFIIAALLGILCGYFLSARAFLVLSSTGLVIIGYMILRPYEGITGIFEFFMSMSLLAIVCTFLGFMASTALIAGHLRKRQHPDEEPD